MLTLKEKREELVKVSGVAPKGSHVRVAKEAKISIAYLYQIRTGTNVTLETDENKTFIQDLINKYRKIIIEEKRKYKEYE